MKMPNYPVSHGKSTTVQYGPNAQGGIDSFPYPIVPPIVENGYVPYRASLADPYIPYIATSTVIVNPVIRDAEGDPSGVSDKTDTMFMIDGKGTSYKNYSFE